MTFTLCSQVFTGRVPFPKITNAHVVVLVAAGERPPKPPGGEALGLRPEVWKLAGDCWNQDPVKRPDVVTVSQRFRKIMTTDLSLINAGDRNKPGGGGPTSSFNKIIRQRSRKKSPQERINMLDQGG